MKKSIYLALSLLFVAFITLNFKCAPGGYVSISLNPSDSAKDVYAGDQYHVEVTLTPDVENKGTVGNFKISVNGDVTVDTTYDSESSVTYTFNYTVPQDAQAGTSITITFEATDGKSGNVSTETVTLNVVEFIPTVVTKTDVQMHFISTDYENSTMIAQLNSDDIQLGGKNLDGDITYVYQATSYGNCILSPNNSYPDEYGSYNGQSYDYANKKQTLFVQDNSIDFDNLTDEAINNLTISESEAGQTGNYGYGYNNVDEGDIFKFQTADGRKGVLRVTYIQQPNPSKGGDDVAIEADIKFDIKYQATAASSAK